MVFNETQKFGGWVIWLLRGCFALMTLLAIYLYLTDMTLIALIILLSSLPFLALEFMRLKTEIDSKTIHINFVPLKKTNIEWSDVQAAELIDYGFVGGWGIRIGTKYGTVYNTQGSEGLFLTLNDGKKIVIGTQRKDELRNLLNKYFTK